MASRRAVLATGTRRCDMNDVMASVNAASSGNSIGEKPDLMCIRLTTADADVQLTWWDRGRPLLDRYQVENTCGTSAVPGLSDRWCAQAGSARVPTACMLAVDV
jgi:hypothetical protein